MKDIKTMNVLDLINKATELSASLSAVKEQLLPIVQKRMREYWLAGKSSGSADVENVYIENGEIVIEYDWYACGSASDEVERFPLDFLSDDFNVGDFVEEKRREMERRITEKKAEDEAKIIEMQRQQYKRLKAIFEDKGD